MKTEVFLPLGMSHTSIDVGPGLEEYAAVRYDGRGNPVPFYISDHPGASQVHSSAHDLIRCRPVWRTFPGWRQKTGGVRRWDDLPTPAREYLEWIEEAAATRIATVSVGAARDAELRRDPS